MQQQINESTIWTEEKEKSRREVGKQDVSWKQLFTVKANLKAIVLLIGIYVFWNLVAGVMGYFMPYIYETVGGLSASQANLLQGFLWTLTVAATYFVFIKLGDRVNRKLLYGVGAGMGIAAWLVLTFGGMGMFELFTFVVLWGIAAGFGAQAFYGLWAGELFHTRYRAKAQGFIFALARIAVGLISLVVPLMITSLGFQAAGMIMIGFLVIAAVVGLIMAPETRGKSLEEIQEDRYGSVEERQREARN
ncbi:MFS transporter [Terribacillus saccharophilus]|nr:MFS transporter [Terribacillus saccharophilus]